MRVLHFGNAGDLSYSLPAVMELSRKLNQPITYYLAQDHPAQYYEGAKHPTKDSNGQQVSLNAKMIEMLIPLLEAQPYIAKAETWLGHSFGVNLSEIRDTFVNMPYSDLRRVYFFVWPDMACDLSKPSIFVPEATEDLAKGKIIISRTERYLNPHVSFGFLKKYEDRLLFAGTEYEHEKFMDDFKLSFPRLIVNNFLELAQAIKQSLFVSGNQSFVFSLAENLKHPRILELCNFAPNVIPVGEKAFDFYRPFAVRYYFDYLFHTETGGAIDHFQMGTDLIADVKAGK